jgi:hypothetical protein
MARDFENPYVKGKSLEELIDDLGEVAEPHSSTWHVIRAAIEVRMAERLADAETMGIGSARCCRGECCGSRGLCYRRLLIRRVAR